MIQNVQDLKSISTLWLCCLRSALACAHLCSMDVRWDLDQENKQVSIQGCAQRFVWHRTYPAFDGTWHYPSQRRHVTAIQATGPALPIREIHQR